MRLGARSYRGLAQVEEELAAATGLGRTNVVAPELAAPEDELTRLSLTGTLPGGRPARVEFVSAGRTADGAPGVLFSVSADHAVRVRVYRETPLLTTLGKAFGLTTDRDSGDARFDDRFVVDAGTEDARRAYEQGLKAAIEAVFERFRIPSLEIEDGRLRVALPRRAIDPGRYGELLRALDRVAGAFNRAPITVRVLGGTRQALAGPGGRFRCAYCHGDITGDEPDLVACERCKTVLHDGCWEEHGRCPVLGCVSATPERRRTDLPERL